MKLINNKTIIFITFILLLSSCEKKTDWQLQKSKNDLIVVDGTITDERKTQTIKINHLVSDLNAIPTPVISANVVLSNEDSTYILREQPANSGNYVTPSYFIAEFGKNYSLLINYNDKIYSAKATMAKGYLFKQLRYSKNTNDSLFHIDWVAYPYNTTKPAMWEVLLDWSNVEGYKHLDSTKNKARLLYYTLSTLDANELFAPQIEQVYFPAGTIITERRYSLTPEHVAYYRAILSETNWRGGLFDNASANIPTNMSDGAIGFFGACSVTSISLTVKP